MESVNVAKYLLVLESLKFTEDEGCDDKSKKIEDSKDEQRLKHNIAILQKFMPENTTALIEKTVSTFNTSWLESELHLHSISVGEDDKELVYAVYMQRMLLEIVNNVNFNSEAKEDLISTRHISLCIEAVQDLAKYALHRQLHATFYEISVFTNERATYGAPLNYPLLLLSIQVIEHLLKIRQLHMANAMEIVMRDYIAAIFSIRLASATQEFSLQEETLKALQNKLNYIWLYVSKVEFLRNIMLLKGLRRAPADLQKQLHHELLQKLLSKDGFTTLVATLHTAQSTYASGTSTNRPMLSDKQVFEIIANIVAFRGHTQRAQNTLIRQIFQFLNTCLLNESAMIDCMGAGLLSLRRLYDLNELNKLQIRDIIANNFSKLSQPADVLSGLIVLEHKELSLLIALTYQLFCSSTVECLPTELLIPYLPLLLQMYHHMPEGFLQKKQLASIVTRCLHNCTLDELQQIVVKLYKQRFDDNWQQLHPRVIIYPNVEQTQLTVKIAGVETKQDLSASLAVPELLMSSNHNILTYRVFMILLQEMSNILDDDAISQHEAQIELLQTEDELITFLNSKYPVKVEILLSLNTLISHQPLKSQIFENITDFLRFLRTLLQKRLNTHNVSSGNGQQTESMDQTLLILLTLTQELLEQSQMPEAYRDLIPALQKLQIQTPNQLIKSRVKCLLPLLNGEFKASAAQQSSAFNTARALVESAESHLQVYGIQMLLELLRQRDSVTLANTHLLIALALSTLKNRESYTFLNCVRLFVGLVHVMETEVLETLADEYLNEQATVDYRLVVGEAMLKVAQELGPLCYKYKDTLLNCFMHGARSPLNEFRMSSFSNLAQLARTLCYQVQHFFQELLNLIDCELSTGKYLPAKRAATLVLSELLEGIDNLLDFEEMLLPIYRVLKIIEADETTDVKMRQHAANGLRTLAAKCKKFLFPAAQMQKEIRIFGINEPETKSGNAKRHILELN
ncbi:transport and Golgi organization protein 6 isoform X1 [Bactrocera dorsalis]|uniref:Transport and Golgi organization protein 6 isoform X1 n=2 Tax=Bactrocera dorsalis TaxID=27457 RepID=A0A6I9UP09_BACDO|nr:transport and Golgi organization protein 6 isoform X1 [Bactrocera dorsalis]